MGKQTEFGFVKDMYDGKSERYTLVAPKEEVDDLLIFSSQSLGQVTVSNSKGQRELHNLSHKDVMFFADQGLSSFEIYRESVSNAGNNRAFYLGYSQFQNPLTRELDRVVWLTE